MREGIMGGRDNEGKELQNVREDMNVKKLRTGIVRGLTTDTSRVTERNTVSLSVKLNTL